MRYFNVKAIEQAIGYKFRNEMILLEAFTHASYANENKVRSYERLEFLGDSILGYYVARYLYDNYPDADEGFLTKAKSNIVSGRTLAEVIDGLGLIEYMRTSSGSSEQEVRSSDKKKEDLFESIVGAIACDSGDTRESWNFAKRQLKSYLEADYGRKMLTDYKSALIERCRHEDREYVFVSERLEDGTFEATALIDGVFAGKGVGHTKKKAEQLAAKEALSVLR